MSAQAEARVRRALESLSIASTTAAEADEEDDDRARDLLAEAKLCKLYDDLLSEGFGVRDVENALTDVVTTRRRATDKTEAAANPMGEAVKTPEKLVRDAEGNLVDQIVHRRQGDLSPKDREALPRKGSAGALD